VKKKHDGSIMCWGMISYSWKGPFWVCEREREEEKTIAAEDIKSYNDNCGREVSCLNTVQWESED